ncbi:MAG TPA: class II fructose-bisphosphate aldolase [Verrucomicrobiota bacterium]|nr:ketose-bisphosphate aldolase [Verrucomicrobiales bacterium]HRI14877.1 class II fructose-bisphosphate aldolase [Verrucomicrobiota bacterium]
MLLTPLQSRVVFRAALEHQFALLAVNADSPAAITDLLEAARQCASPIIVETSLWQLTGHSFGAGDAALGMARYLVQLALLAEAERFREVPVLFHTDHIKGPLTLPLLRAAIRGLPTGVGDSVVSPSTISLDSSQLDEAQNVAAITALCQEATAVRRPLTLEMEAGVDDGITPLEVAQRLLNGVESQTPGFVHLWAPGVGTKHGLGNPNSFSAASVQQHQELASRLTGRAIGIALHGSSGLPESALQAAVAAGVVKVNWSSESLLIRSRAAQEYYAKHREQLDPSHPEWKATAMDHGLQQFVAERYQPRVAERICLLGGAGQAPRCLKLLNQAV